jgi:Xaa-Pro aminopeptidase
MLSFEDAIENIQNSLKEYQIDGWLIYDYRGSNPYLKDIFQLSWHATRRFFLFIPKVGEVEALSHTIEDVPLDHLPIRKRKFSSYQDLEDHLREWVEKAPKLAMEYSPMAHLPNLSKLDAGTFDWLKSLGAQIVSSQNILSHLYVETIDLESHLKAAQLLSLVFEKSFQWLKAELEQKGHSTEKALQNHVLTELKIAGLETNDLPICAVDDNSSRPHYTLIGEGKKIQKGSLVLLDIWGKLPEPNAIYADMTQMALVGRKPTSKEKEVFNAVYEAQQEAIHYCQNHGSFKGKDVDLIARQRVRHHQLDQYFTHRLGHSIGVELHGPLANLDSFETIDDRLILPGSCFSIEPGVYLPGEFGVRLECDALFTQDRTIQITTPRQSQFIEI